MRPQLKSLRGVWLQKSAVLLSILVAAVFTFAAKYSGNEMHVFSAWRLRRAASVTTFRERVSVELRTEVGDAGEAHPTGNAAAAVPSPPAALPSLLRTLPHPPYAGCAPGTRPHPSLKDGTVEGGGTLHDAPPWPCSTPDCADAALASTLQGWGLHPLPSSPRTLRRLLDKKAQRDSEDEETSQEQNDEADRDRRVWRGWAVDVKSDPSSSLSLPAMRAGSAQSPRAERDAGDVHGRAEWHYACTQFSGPHGKAIDVASKRSKVFDPTTVPFMLKDRAILAQHGAEVAFRLRSWLRDTASLLKRRSMEGIADDEANQYGFATPRSSFHSGPWIQDHWIATFARPVAIHFWWDEEFAMVVGNRTGLLPANPRDGSVLPIGEHIHGWENPFTRTTSLHALAPYDVDLFLPYVPLFVPWEALSVALAKRDSTERENVYCSLAITLKTLLKPNVQYVTVTQRPSGPWLADDPLSDCSHTIQQALVNVLVLSSGGVGHVPLPLLGRAMPFLQCAASADVAQGEHAEPGSSMRALVFVGAPHSGLRMNSIHAIMQADAWAARALLSTPWELKDLLMDTPRGADMLRFWNTSREVVRAMALPETGALWIRTAASGALSLAPAGVGPTSFRLYEALQMGLAPVYIHHGAPWLPYLKRYDSPVWMDGLPRDKQSLWARIGVVVDVRDIVDWLTVPPPVGASFTIPRPEQGAGRQPGPLPPRLTKLMDPSNGLVEAMRIDAEAVRDRYFTFDGVTRRIAEFFDDPTSAELDCQGSSSLPPQ